MAPDAADDAKDDAQDARAHFFQLTPDALLDAVERALGARSTGRCFQLNSMENRVWEIELEDESRVVAKFYRPGRWSKEAIGEEHRFLAELVEAEVPAVAPLALAGGGTLDSIDGRIHFAVFPKVRGRGKVELTDLELAIAGRLLGRLHNVGTRSDAPSRRRLTVDEFVTAPLAVLGLADGAPGILPPGLAPRYLAIARGFAERAAPLLARAPKIRLHGDCHLGNVLWNESGPFFLDFDDMLVGPPVQDVWLVVRGRGEEADRQRDVLLAGYEQMRAFDRAELALIEPLRGLRMIHYAAWVARRYDDPSFPRAFPDWGSSRYWSEELASLDETLALCNTGYT